ncbi:MAG: hypothetical protein GTO18_02510 [Anaerolineales bacterium]|nr:hypothetical protein [Anaerolineales bacterium]
MKGMLAAAEHSYGLTLDDVQSVADSLAPGQAAALLLIEHTWATGFRNAMIRAGGEMVLQGFLTPETLFLVGAELEAQAEAIEAIVVSEAIQEMAAQRAIDALITAELIEEAAIEEAVAVEEAAIEEAEMVVEVAEAVEGAAIEEAVEVVATAEMIEEAAIEEAEEVVAAAEEMKKEAEEEEEEE